MLSTRRRKSSEAMIDKRTSSSDASATKERFNYLLIHCGVGDWGKLHGDEAFELALHRRKDGFWVSASARGQSTDRIQTGKGFELSGAAEFSLVGFLVPRVGL